MISKRLHRDAPWSVTSRLVFWNRDVSLEDWREGILAAKRAYLPDSVQHMQPVHFVKFLGREAFIKEWPRVRHALEASHPGRAKLDLYWSRLSTGTFDADPDACLLNLPGRSREAYDYLVKNQGASVYQLAQDVNIPYRRAHDHVTRLTEVGLISSRYTEDEPRLKRRLYTMKTSQRSVPSELLVSPKVKERAATVRAFNG